MKKWRVGLIGTGHWSEYHLRSWSMVPNAEIAALCNRSSDKLHRRARQFGVKEDRLYTNLDDMLERADLDVVDIVTGPETHLEFVCKSAAAGKHILCQKPFAPTLEEAREIVRVAKQAGVRLMVTENWRWLSAFQITRRVLDSGMLGSIKAARYTHKSYYTPRMAPGVELPQPFFRNMPRLIFYEMGTHWCDVLHYLFGMPKQVMAQLWRSSPYVAGEDSGVAVFGYDGFCVVLDATWATRELLRSPLPERVRNETDERLVIDGDKATLKMAGMGNYKAKAGTISIVDANGVEVALPEPTQYDQQDSNLRVISHFVQCLDTGEPFQTGGEYYLQVVRMVEAIYQSAAHCYRLE